VLPAPTASRGVGLQHAYRLGFRSDVTGVDANAFHGDNRHHPDFQPVRV
jgi:hypothetical protein